MIPWQLYKVESLKETYYAHVQSHQLIWVFEKFYLLQCSENASLSFYCPLLQLLIQPLSETRPSKTPPSDKAQQALIGQLARSVSIVPLFPARVRNVGLLSRFSWLCYRIGRITDEAFQNLNSLFRPFTSSKNYYKTQVERKAERASYVSFKKHLRVNPCPGWRCQSIVSNELELMRVCCMFLFCFFLVPLTFSCVVRSSRFFRTFAWRCWSLNLDFGVWLSPGDL